jgi:hypothetical protein
MAVTPADLAKLTPIERGAFISAAALVADERKPPMLTIVILVETIERLITEPAGELVAEGAGPLLDPDCRDGKCGSCTGPPCEHECHRDGS